MTRSTERQSLDRVPLQILFQLQRLRHIVHPVFQFFDLLYVDRHNTECQLIFDFKLPSAVIADTSKIFLIKYDSCNNLLFKLSRL